MGLAKRLSQPISHFLHPGLERIAQDRGVWMAFDLMGMISHLIKDTPVPAFFLDSLFPLGVGIKEQVVEDCALA